MGRSVLRNRCALVSLLSMPIVTLQAGQQAAGWPRRVSRGPCPTRRNLTAGRHAGMIACLRWRVRSWVTVRCPLLGPGAVCRGVLQGVEFFAVFFGAGMVGALEAAAVANEALI